MVKIPVPTSGVRVEVNTEEDWTRNVITAPMAMAIYLIRAQKIVILTGKIQIK